MASPHNISLYYATSSYKFFRHSKILPLIKFGICFTGDNASSLYTDASSTETGLGCSGATTASSADVLSSSNIKVDF